MTFATDTFGKDSKIMKNLKVCEAVKGLGILDPALPLAGG